MNAEEITKAQGAMNHLLMAYGEMIAYSFEGAHELRAKTMEVIHELEHFIAGTELAAPEYVETSHHDEEMYKKEIVREDGQYCVRSKDGSRSFGCYISRERAEERLQQIEQFAEKAKGVSTENLMTAYKRTNDVLSGSAVHIITEIIDEELTKRIGQVYELETQESETPFATILKAEQRYTMGPVYVPGLEDAHGETILAEELQTSIWDWVRKGDRTIFLQHSDKPAGEMVEILTWPMEIETSLVVPGEGVTKYSFPENTPFMGVIWEDWAWELVKEGKLRGYSIGGQAHRVEVDLV